MDLINPVIVGFPARCKVKPHLEMKGKSEFSVIKVSAVNEYRQNILSMIVVLVTKNNVYDTV